MKPDYSVAEITELLREVKDPEIPAISLVDLGVITHISILENGVDIQITPTFVGCPALDYMKKDIITVLNDHGISDVHVTVSFETTWNSNRITTQGRKALKEYGLAPPPMHNFIIDIDILSHVNCPVCGSDNTSLKNAFGPTACRSIHYCNNCRETFEQFKPV